jgi:DNA helicase-2/ATP-dependent DNA helicase PcrA
MKTLTPQQQRAVESPAQTTVVTACPGSGKTETIAARVARLVEMGENPSGFVLLSFTNAAADELAARAQTRVGVPVRWGYVGTLHGYCLRLAMRHGAKVGLHGNPSVMGEERRRVTLERLKTKHRLEKVAEDELAKALADCLPFGRKPKTKAEVLAAEFHQRNFENGEVDFDALLRVGLAIARSELVAIRHLVVDETQDSGRVDAEIYSNLQALTTFMVGDPDQSIYGFRGGDPAFLISEAEFAAKVTGGFVSLTRNFRSLPPIVAAANRLIARNPSTLRTPMIPARADDGGDAFGLFSASGEMEEAAKICGEIRVAIAAGTPPSECAILCRTNAVAAGFRRAVVDFGLPLSESRQRTTPPGWPVAQLGVAFMLNPHSPSAGAFIAAVKGWSEAELARREMVALERSLSLAQSENFLPTTDRPLPFLRDCGVDRLACDYLAAMDFPQPVDLPMGPDELSALSLAMATAGFDATFTPGVRVMTIHGAKGLEFDAVWCPGWGENQFPHPAATRDEKRLQEERRLAFVAITRARNRLRISYPEAVKPYPMAKKNTPQSAGIFWLEARG